LAGIFVCSNEVLHLTDERGTAQQEIDKSSKVRLADPVDLQQAKRLSFYELVRGSGDCETFCGHQ
jgi:hypothetical protein